MHVNYGIEKKKLQKYLRALPCENNYKIFPAGSRTHQCRQRGTLQKAECLVMILNEQMK